MSTRRENKTIMVEQTEIVEVYTCDRCGAENESVFKDLPPLVPNGWGRVWLSTGNTPDLCSDCIEDLKGWMAEKVKL